MLGRNGDSTRAQDGESARKRGFRTDLLVGAAILVAVSSLFFIFNIEAFLDPFTGEHTFDSLIGIVVGILAAVCYMAFRDRGRLAGETKRRQQAEAELAANEQRFRDYAEVSSDWFWGLDRELRMSFLSAGTEQRTGENPGALIGEVPSKDGLLDVTEEDWSAHMADLRARRPVVDFRFARADGQGRLRHFSVSAKPIYDAAGQFAGYRGTGRDITELVEARRFLRQVIDAIPALVAVRDAQSRYLLVNSAFARLCGTTQKELIGKTAGTFLGAEAGARVRKRDIEIFESGAPTEPLEVRLRGRGDATERTWLNQLVPLRDTAGGIAAVLSIGVDITTQKEAEAAILRAQERLRDSEQRFRDFAEAASNIFWETDKDLRITFMSDSVEAITGFPARAYVGRTNLEVAPGDPARQAAHAMVEQRRAFRDLIFSPRAADGRMLHLSYSGKPLFAEDGAFLGYRGTTRDVTAQHEAEQEAARLRQARDLAAAADLAKSRFLAHMSHELRTPLNAILGFSELMLAETFGPLGADHYRGYMKDIQNSGQHLLGIINDLLDKSRIELGQFTLAVEDVEIAVVVQEAVRIARGATKADQAKIHLEPVDPGWVAQVDRRVIRQVLVNLLSNATKFTPREGQIRVGVASGSGGALLMRVADNGAGIEPERMAKIFEPFQHQQAGHARKGQGAGLGLWLSRSLVELHGGTLDLDSRLDEGTTATVTLPATRIVGGPASHENRVWVEERRRAG